MSYSQSFTCSNPHVDRCSNPLGTPLVPLQSHPAELLAASQVLLLLLPVLHVAVPDAAPDAGLPRGRVPGEEGPLGLVNPAPLNPFKEDPGCCISPSETSRPPHMATHPESGLRQSNTKDRSQMQTHVKTLRCIVVVTAARYIYLGVVRACHNETIFDNLFRHRVTSDNSSKVCGSCLIAVLVCGTLRIHS